MTDTAALGVGRALAEAREAQGLEIADIAQQIKFMPRQIQALEAERFDSLPGPTIARGMVRTYARFLKLDPEPLLQRMSGRVEPRDATPQLAERYNQPVPFSDSGRRTTVAYLALSAVVLAVAGGVLYEWRSARKAPAVMMADSLDLQMNDPAPAPKAHKPEARKPLAKAEPPRPVAKVEARAPSPKSETAEAPELKTPKAETPKPATPKPETPKPAVAADTPAPAPKAPAPDLPVVAAKDIGARLGGANRLVLQFEEDAWAEVVDANGRQLISSLNRAGTQRMVRVSPPFNVVLGNAQHVKMIYNDRPFDLAPHIKVEVARFTVK